MAKARKTPEKYERRAIQLNHRSVEDAVQAITSAAEGLRSASIVIESYARYGDTEIEVHVCGHVPMTREELAEQRRQKREQKRQAEERDRATYEALKARFEEE